MNEERQIASNLESSDWSTDLKPSVCLHIDQSIFPIFPPLNLNRILSEKVMYMISKLYEENYLLNLFKVV